MTRATFDHGRVDIDAVAFDLDGTLVDSAADIGHALDSALSDAGLQRFDVDTVKGWIGDGPDVLIQRAMAAQGLVGSQSSLLQRRLRRAFDATALAAPLDRGRVYGGVTDLLAALAEQMPLAVVTNKPTSLALAVLESARLLSFMTLVQGADTDAMRKPAPTMLLSSAHRLGVSAARLLMVGDSTADLGAAAAAGCAGAWVSWGYGKPSDSIGVGQTAGRLWRLDCPDDLMSMLQRSALNAG